MGPFRDPGTPWSRACSLAQAVAEAAQAHAELIDGTLVTALAEVARDTGTCLHAGSIAEITPDGSFHNTAVLFAPDGTRVAHYRKIHLFGFAEGEADVMSAGEDVVVASTPQGRTAVVGLVKAL